MPVFGGVARVKIGGNIYLFDKVYMSLHLAVPLPVDAVACAEFRGMWRCGLTVIPAGTWDIVGERWFGGPIPVLDADLAYSLASVPPSEIEVVARRNPSYDPVWGPVAVERGYLYMFIYDKLKDNQDFDVYCRDESGRQTADTYVRGPTVLFAYYHKIEGYENGGYGNCTYVRMGTRNYYTSDQAPIVLRISNVAYITPIRIALFAYGRGILLGTRKEWLTAMVDLTSVNL
jgi:hypothetical protein